MKISCGGCDEALPETGFVFCVDGEPLCPECARGMLEDTIEDGQPGHELYEEALITLNNSGY